MFGMSFGEILIIAIVAILFLGPDKLPEAMVKIAKFFKSFKKSINEAKDTIEQEIHLSELKEGAISYKQQLEDSMNDLKNSVNVVDDLNEEVKDISKSITKLDEPTPSKEKPKLTPKENVTEDKKDSKDV